MLVVLLLQRRVDAIPRFQRGNGRAQFGHEFAVLVRHGIISRNQDPRVVQLAVRSRRSGGSFRVLSETSATDLDGRRLRSSLLIRDERLASIISSRSGTAYAADSFGSYSVTLRHQRTASSICSALRSYSSRRILRPPLLVASRATSSAGTLSPAMTGRPERRSGSTSMCRRSSSCRAAQPPRRRSTAIFSRSTLAPILQ